MTDFEKSSSKLRSKLSEGYYSEPEIPGRRVRESEEGKRSQNPRPVHKLVHIEEAALVAYLGLKWNVAPGGNFGSRHRGYACWDEPCVSLLSKSGNDESMQTGVRLHDLHLDFCQRQAKSGLVASKKHVSQFSA